MPIHANINALRWESDFFALSCAGVSFDASAAPLTKAALNAWDLVQAKVPAGALQQLDALSALGFSLAEGEIDCCYQLRPLSLPGVAEAPPRAPVAEMRLANAGDIAAVRQLAASTLVHSRFRPPWFTPADRQRFYAQWAENAILGSFDHCCLLAGSQPAPSGMVTLRQVAPDQARIGLLAVAPALTGRGYGRLLINAALAWCRDRQIEQLHVATQTANLAALRLYLRSGATIDSTAYWLYRGKDDSI